MGFPVNFSNFLNANPFCLVPTIASLGFFNELCRVLLNHFTFFLICDTQFTGIFNTVLLKSLQVALGFLPFWLLFQAFTIFCDFYVFPLLEFGYLRDVFVWLTLSQYTTMLNSFIFWSSCRAVLPIVPLEAGPVQHLRLNPEQHSFLWISVFIVLIISQLVGSNLLFPYHIWMRHCTWQYVGSWNWSVLLPYIVVQLLYFCWVFNDWCL